MYPDRSCSVRSSDRRTGILYVYISSPNYLVKKLAEIIVTFIEFSHIENFLKFSNCHELSEAVYFIFMIC